MEKCIKCELLFKSDENLRCHMLFTHGFLKPICSTDIIYTEERYSKFRKEYHFKKKRMNKYMYNFKNNHWHTSRPFYGRKEMNKLIEHPVYYHTEIIEKIKKLPMDEIYINKKIDDFEKYVKSYNSFSVISCICKEEGVPLNI